MVFPWVLCCLLFFLNALWVLKILLMKKDLKSMAMEFRDYLDKETNSLLTIPTRDRHIQKIAAEINSGLRNLRRLRHRYMNGDRELKEAVRISRMTCGHRLQPYTVTLTCWNMKKTQKR